MKFFAGALLFGSACFAQVPTFEVASIKPSPPTATERSLTHNAGARLTTSNATLRMLILLAYQVMPDQISGGPAWLESDGFDIDARASDPKATPAQFRQMIQNLLADRFQLQVHRASKELPLYALVVARNGPKLTEAKPDASDAGVRIEAPGRMTGRRATMAMFCTALTKALQRQVIDQTGLTGNYDLQLQFTPDPTLKAGKENPEPASDWPSIFTALPEQLGLSLKATRGPVEVLVIDRAERPSAN